MGLVGQPMGVSKSLWLIHEKTGVPSHAKNLDFKRCIAPGQSKKLGIVRKYDISPTS